MIIKYFNFLNFVDILKYNEFKLFEIIYYYKIVFNLLLMYLLKL